MIINYPDEVKNIIDKLNRSGYEAFIVGGCVRDCLMDNIPHDWDICTSAKPDEIESCFEEYKTLDIGKKHGTIGVIINKKLYEVTTYRVDGQYIDNRRPDSVEFTSNIKNDLSRRDFTINAIAYNEKDGLIDCFGGIEDINKRLIKCVGDPKSRFNEDSLRILRGLRFASRFDFDIDGETSNAIHNQKHLLQNISAERIREELTGIICGKACERILCDYRDVIAEFIPELIPCFDFDQRTPHHCFDVYRHITRTVGLIEPEPILKLTMLLHDIGKPQACKTDPDGRRHFKGHQLISAQMAEVILRRLRFSNAIISDCVKLIEYHDVRFKGSKPTVRRVTGILGAENTERLFKIQYADTMAQSEYRREQKLNDLSAAKQHFEEIINNNECCTLKQLDIKGNELKDECGINGRDITDTLEYLLDLVINEKVKNNKAALINAAKEKANSN